MGHEASDMIILSAPYRRPYIVKSCYAGQIANGTTPQSMRDSIRHNAMLFAKNNLKKKRCTLPISEG